MLGGYQVEHLHLIAMAAEQLRCVGVKLALTVGDDGGFPPLYNAEQRRADQPPGLTGPGCSKHRNVPVEPGVHRETHGISVSFAQQDSVRLRDGAKLQHLFSFLFSHPRGGAVGSLFAYREPPGVLQPAAQPGAELSI